MLEKPGKDLLLRGSADDSQKATQEVAAVDWLVPHGQNLEAAAGEAGLPEAAKHGVSPGLADCWAPTHLSAPDPADEAA